MRLCKSDECTEYTLVYKTTFGEPGNLLKLLTDLTNIEVKYI